MTDYLMLIRNDGNPMADLSPEQMQAHLQEWGAWMGGLAEQGRLVGGRPLGQPAACVSRDVVTDGPYAEAKDVVGGYVIVSAETLDEAIEIARACPSVALGSVLEVRATEANVLE